MTVATATAGAMVELIASAAAAAAGSAAPGGTARRATRSAVAATRTSSRLQRRSSTSLKGTARSWNSSSGCRRSRGASRRSRETRRRGRRRAPRCSPLPQATARGRRSSGSVVQLSRASSSRWRRQWRQSVHRSGPAHLPPRQSRRLEEEAEVQSSRCLAATAAATRRSAPPATYLRLPCCERGSLARLRRQRQDRPRSLRRLQRRRRQLGLRKVGCAVVMSPARSLLWCVCHLLQVRLVRLFSHQCFLVLIALPAGGPRHETIVLPKIDARGRAVPGAFGREEAGNGMADGGGCRSCPGWVSAAFGLLSPHALRCCASAWATRLLSFPGSHEALPCLTGSPSVSPGAVDAA